MISLARSIQKNVYKRGIIKVIFLFSCVPIVILLINLVNDEFLILGGDGISLLGFVNLLMNLMNSLFIPIALIIQLAVHLYYDEYKHGQILFYKDMSKIKVYRAKQLVIFVTYILYLTALFTSIIFMYIVMKNGDYGLSDSVIGSDSLPNLVQIITIILSQILLIEIGISISIHYSSVYAIMGVFLYFIIGKLSMRMGLLKLLFVETYLSMGNPIGGIINSIAVFIVITILIQYVNQKLIVRIET